MIFATGKNLRKLDDAALDTSLGKWKYADNRFRAQYMARLLLAGCVGAAILAFVASPPVAILCTVYSSVVGSVYAFSHVTRHNTKRLEREIASRERDKQARAEAEADWLAKAPPQQQPPQPLPDLGHDFHLGTSRQVGVKPALKLITLPLRGAGPAGGP